MAGPCHSVCASTPGTRGACRLPRAGHGTGTGAVTLGVLWVQRRLMAGSFGGRGAPLPGPPPASPASGGREMGGGGLVLFFACGGGAGGREAPPAISFRTRVGAGTALRATGYVLRLPRAGHG